MIFEAIISGIILGYLKKGRLENLNHIKIRGIYFGIVVLIFDFTLRFFILHLNHSISDFLFEIYPYINLALYFIIIAFLEFNNKIKFFRIIEAGFLLNFLPMLLNGGKMPVSADAMKKIDQAEKIFLLENDLLFGHNILNENARFKIFADIIPLKFLIPKVISLGDIVITIGIVLFIVHYMSESEKKR